MSPDSIAVPVDNGQPARAQVTSLGDLWTLAWGRDGGRLLEPFGEPYRDVRRACRDANRINARTGQ